VGQTNKAVVILIAGILLLGPARLLSDDATKPRFVPQEVPNNPLAPQPPIQPISFSHKLHSEQGVTCEYCHTNPAPGVLMTLPSASTCMGCHRVIAKDKPAIQKLAEYSRSKQPIPWVRVYTLTPGLHWTHRKHLEAGKKCEACHGEVAKMDHMAEATSTTTMFSCLNCHQKNQAKTECKTCHVWP
jgi:hypothetical protein